MSKYCPRQAHDAMKADPAIWETLQLIGYQPVEADPDDPINYPAELHETRNCHCGSTLGKRIK